MLKDFKNTLFRSGAFITISCSWLAAAQAGTASIEGRLFEKGTRKPLAGVHVFILPQKLRAESGPNGQFSFAATTTGSVHWVVNTSGYQPLDQEFDLPETDPPQPIHITLYLEKLTYGAFETTIYDHEESRDDSVHSLKARDFETMPGSGGDPLKAIRNMPGMGRSNSDAQAIIQGSAPKDTHYTIDGHEVPLSFHFLGNSSVIQPEAIDRVDYFSAGYGATYGRAMGGIIGLWTRDPQRDRWHGLAFGDIYNAGALVEGPSGEKSAFLFGLRRSYVDIVLNLFLKNNDNFDFRVIPNFEDLTSIFSTEITPIDQFRLVTIGSLDTYEFLLKNPVGTSSSARGDFNYQTAFVRIIPELTHHHSARTVSRWSFALGRSWSSSKAPDYGFNFRANSLSSRVELEQKINDEWSSVAGFDDHFSANSLQLTGGSYSQRLNDSDALLSENLVAGYVTETYHAHDSSWTWLPGARIDYFSTTHQWLPAPRLAARYSLDPTWTLRGAGGNYYQSPEDREVNPNTGNPDLKAPHAWHLALGAEKDFRQGSSQGLVASFGGFYRFFQDLVAYTPALTTRNGYLMPLVNDNSGRGRAFGTEALIRWETPSVKFWISYTLSRSTRWDPRDAEHLFQYDQTHNLNLLAGVDLPRNWKLSTRFRYVTGDPYTPYISSLFDADRNSFSGISGTLFSERLGNFFQLDLRADKKWVYNTWILSGYLDVQNITNRSNPEVLRYSYDYSRSVVISGIPILPTLGVKAEF